MCAARAHIQRQLALTAFRYRIAAFPVLFFFVFFFCFYEIYHPNIDVIVHDRIFVNVTILWTYE